MKIILPSALVIALVTGFRPLRLTKASLPVLKCLRFDVMPGTLTVTGSDLDEALTYTVPLPTAETATLLVQFDLLVEASKQADDGLILDGDKGKWSLTGYADGVKLCHVVNAPDAKEFPPDIALAPTGQPTPAGFIRSLIEALTAAS